MKLLQTCTYENIDEKSVLMSAILIIFGNKSMCWTRSIGRPLEVEYLLSILGRTSISLRQYMNSKSDSFAFDCHSKRIVLVLLQVVSRRNANVFCAQLFSFMHAKLWVEIKSTIPTPPFVWLYITWTSSFGFSFFVTPALSCIVVNTTTVFLPAFSC